MSGPGPQRLADVGAPRMVAYALCVGTAAYVLTAAFGPDGLLLRVVTAALLGVGYVAAVHAVGTLRRRRAIR